MAESGTVLMTVTIPQAKPGIVEAAEALGVGAGAIDRGFGVVLVDPQRNLYAIQVRASEVPTTSATDYFRGPFANPKIAPFGPTGR